MIKRILLIALILASFSTTAFGSAEIYRRFLNYSGGLYQPYSVGTCKVLDSTGTFTLYSEIVPAETQEGVYYASVPSGCQAGVLYQMDWSYTPQVWSNPQQSLTGFVLPSSGGTAFVNVTAIGDYLAAQHGAGLWGGNVSVLPFQGAVSYAGPTANGSIVRMKQGDTPTILVHVTSGGQDFDLTGWTADFAAKANVTDANYAIAVRPATITDSVHGEVSITLANADTANLPPGLYHAELKIYQGTQILTAWTCSLFIDPAIIH